MSESTPDEQGVAVEDVLKDFKMDRLELEDGDVVTDIVVLIRSQRLDDTDDFLIISRSSNTGGMVCHGILTSAVLRHSMWMTEGRKGED